MDLNIFTMYVNIMVSASETDIIHFKPFFNGSPLEGKIMATTTIFGTSNENLQRANLTLSMGLCGRYIDKVLSASEENKLANNENSFSLFGIEKVVDFKMIEENGQFIGVRVLHSIPSKVWKTRNGNEIGGERVLKMSTVWFVENHSDLCHDDFNARQAQITKIYKKAVKKSASEENKKTVKVCCVLHKANGETKKIAKVFKKVA